MKQVSKKQWLLTASLFAVLIGNYTFQTSTQNMGAFEMSSIDQIIESQKTQAAATEPAACTTGECKTSVASVTMAMSDLTNINKKMDDQNSKINALILENQRMDELLKNKVAKNSEVTDEKLKNKEDDSDCDAKKDKETRSEKKERELCLKKEKATKKTDALILRFDDKMESIKDKCAKDLECIASEFTAVLAQFDGTKAIPSAKVNQYYKSMIANPLTKTLYTDNGGVSQALEILQTVMNDVPEQYREIKKITMDSVSIQAMVPAAKIKQGYKNAELLSKQNNPQGYLEQINQTREEQNILAQQTTAYTATIKQALTENGDTSSFNYYRTNYEPKMDQILKLMNISTTESTQKVDVSNNTRNSRNGQEQQTSNQTTTSNQQQQDASKMTNTRSGTNTTQTPWTVSTGNNNVNIGTPATTRGNNIRGHN